MQTQDTLQLNLIQKLERGIAGTVCFKVKSQSLSGSVIQSLSVPLTDHDTMTRICGQIIGSWWTLECGKCAVEVYFLSQLYKNGQAWISKHQGRALTLLNDYELRSNLNVQTQQEVLDWTAEINASVVSNIWKFMCPFQYVWFLSFCSTNGIFKKMKVINAHGF